MNEITEWNHKRLIFDFIASGNYTGVQKMLDRISVDISDNDGVSILHFALMCRRDNIASMLIRRGANVNTATKSQGRTPLHTVELYENKKMIALIQANGGIKRQDKYGN